MVHKLTNNFDVIIVGGGIIGMLTARCVQAEGLNVALIDKGQLGGKATWAAGGILSPLNPWQHNSLTQSLVNEGKQNFAALAEELKQETNIDPEYFQSGMLALNIDEQQHALDWAKHNNEKIEVFSQSELIDFEPALAKTFNQALYLPNIAQVRPPKLIKAVQQSLMQRNVYVLENTAIKNLNIQNNTVKGVFTEQEKFFADKVIICGGAWTKKILTEDARIDIEPVRGQMLLYKPDTTILSHIVLKEKSYLIPRQDGHILCGSTLEHVGFNNKITQEARQELQAIAHKLVPKLEKIEPIKQWSALRPGTQRDAPYICKHPNIQGLYLNSGHYRYGIIMSIASARIVTKMITNSLSASQITAFA